MFVVDLGCENGHSFEGWYGSYAEYEEILSEGALTCPLCGSSEVTRQLSATAIATKAPPPSSPPAQRAPAPLPLEAQRALAAVVEHVQRTHEDVGGDFARQAAAMHRGEQEARPIYGQATPEQERQLTEEGVPVAKLPIPDIMKN